MCFFSPSPESKTTFFKMLGLKSNKPYIGIKTKKYHTFEDKKHI